MIKVKMNNKKIKLEMNIDNIIETYKQYLEFLNNINNIFIQKEE